MFDSIEFTTLDLLDEGDEGEHNRAESRRLIAFESADRLYGLPISHIAEVRQPLPITPLPIGQATKFVLGLVSLRGTILPVIDLAIALGFAPSTQTDSQPLLIVKGPSWQVAWSVTRVLGMVRLPINAFQPPPPTLPGVQFCEAVSRWEGRPLLQLNSAELIRATSADPAKAPSP